MLPFHLYLEALRGESPCIGDSKQSREGTPSMSLRGIPSWNGWWLCFLGFGEVIAGLELLVGRPSALVVIEAES